MKTVGGVVTGHYAGAFTRLAAFVLDWVIILTSYSLILAGTSFVLSMLFGLDLALSDNTLPWLIGLVVWVFLYAAIALIISGKTLGKTIVGLKVVLRDGSPLTPVHAIIRVLALPLSFLIFGLGFLGVLFGKERRALHDVIAGSAVVYDWGDRSAELPAPLTNWLEQKNALKASAVFKQEP